MVACMAAQDAIAQNLANANTTGYKEDVPQFESFQSMLLDRMSGAASGGGVGTLGTGVAVQGIATDFTPGALQSTGNPLDVALTGNAYLTVSTPQGARYTRDGSLTRSSDGTLVQSGTMAPVLDSNNRPITLPATAKNITISPQGVIAADGNTVAQLGLVGLDGNSGASKVGDNQYVAAKTTAPSSDSTVRQGYLETSNVSVVREMVAMIQAQRIYETNSKMLEAEDGATSKAISSVATVS